MGEEEGEKKKVKKDERSQENHLGVAESQENRPEKAGCRAERQKLVWDVGRVSSRGVETRFWPRGLEELKQKNSLPAAFPGAVAWGALGVLG